MSRHRLGLIGLLVLGTLIVSFAGTGYAHSLGVGVYYQETLGNIEESEEFDSDAINWLVSYQHGLGDLFKIEADVEFVPDFGGSDEIMYMPQGYLLFGSLLYGGAGIGVAYFDGEWADDPFYAGRIGVDLPIGESFSIDINANYRFLDMDVLEELEEDDADSITFGAVLRYGF